MTPAVPMEQKVGPRKSSGKRGLRGPRCQTPLGVGIVLTANHSQSRDPVKAVWRKPPLCLGGTEGKEVLLEHLLLPPLREEDHLPPQLRAEREGRAPLEAFPGPHRRLGLHLAW